MMDPMNDTTKTLMMYAEMKVLKSHPASIGAGRGEPSEGRGIFWEAYDASSVDRCAGQRRHGAGGGRRLGVGEEGLGRAGWMQGELGHILTGTGTREGWARRPALHRGPAGSEPPPRCVPKLIYILFSHIRTKNGEQRPRTGGDTELAVPDSELE